MRNAGLNEAQSGIKFGGEIAITSGMLHPKGDQSWVSIERTDVEAEIPILWPPDVKSRLTGKDAGAGKDRGQEGKGMIEDEVVKWHH